MRFDIIKKLIVEMDYHIGLENFEEAKDALNRIKQEFEKKVVYNVSFEELVGNKKRDIIIKDIHDMLIDNTIRLELLDFRISDWIDLLLRLYRRKDELHGGRYIDIDRHRRIVAEEMAYLKMVIPKKSSSSKKPNRRFLDIAYDVNPDLSRIELRRRGSTKLWLAIEKGSEDDIEKVKCELSEYNK